MKQVRLCVVDQGEIFGGAECFALDLVKVLPKDTYEVFLCVSNEVHPTYKQALEETFGVHMVHITIPKLKPMSFRTFFSFLGSCYSLWRFVKRERIDLMYSNTVRAHLVSSMVSFITGIPLLWVVHDFTFPSKFLKLLIPIPRKIVGVSEVILSFLRTTVGDVYNHKLCIIPNGVNTEKELHPTKEIFIDLQKKEFHFEKTKRYIGIIGRIDIWKGQDTFIEAAKIFYEQHGESTDVEFLIIGGVTDTSEDRKAYFSSLLESSKSSGFIHFLGHQSIEEVLPRLHILVQASTAPEPFGRTVIEAFHGGVPVIASSLGAMRDIISYGNTGLTFEVGNAQDLSQKIALLLEDKHLYSTLKVNAQREVRAKYSLQRVFQLFHREFSEMLYKVSTVNKK